MTWDDAIVRIRARVEDAARSGHQGFPHFADPETTRWTWSKDGDWTGGYFNAMLWLGAACGPSADRERWLRWARDFTERLRPRLASDSSSRALLFYYGAALGSILCGDRAARDLALEAARALEPSLIDADVPGIKRELPLPIEIEPRRSLEIRPRMFGPGDGAFRGTGDGEAKTGERNREVSHGAGMI